MDLNRLSVGEKVIGVACVALLVLSFLPFWAKYELNVDVPGVGTSRYHAWSGAFNFLPKVALFLALVALGLVIARAVGSNIDLPWSLGAIYLGIMATATVLLLVTLVVGPVEFGPEILGVLEVSRGPLLAIGWLIAAGATLGAYMHMQQESTASRFGPARRPSPPPSV